MGKSRKGGVYGFLRGKVGSVTFSILSAKYSSSGKKEQLVRALPDSVANPQTVSQVMQRMKIRPAQRFYGAFAELLSNAFQGVEYGEASRRFFLSEAMKMTGPYVQRGVDRFVPAEYPFSRGSLPSVGIVPFDGGTDRITLNAVTDEATVTPAILASALGVAVDTQISVAVVNNMAGVFEPSYIGFDDRVKIADLPATALTKDATSNQIQLVISELGLPADAIVACAVVLSRQDASGAWLRSEQNLVISNQLRQSLYSQDALQAAILSYQDQTKGANSINSEWYYNLGLNQAFNGQITLLSLRFEGGAADILVGLQQVGGQVRYTAFATSLEDDGEIIGVSGQQAVIAQLSENETVTVLDMRSSNPNVRIMLYDPSIAAQGGYENGVTVETSKVYYRQYDASNLYIVDGAGRLLIGNYDGGMYYYYINGRVLARNIGSSQESVIAAWGSIDVDAGADGATSWFVLGGVTYSFGEEGVITPAVEGEFQG